MLKIIKHRIKEPTTWIGLSMLATLMGVPPDVVAASNKLLAALAALGGIALPENSN